MWDLTIAGFDLYHIAAWFWIYSFFGWIWESLYVSVKNRKLVNRGFVAGPVVTIYGCGAVTIYLLLYPLQSNGLFLYVGGVLVATVLEYLTGVLMEAIFHTNWWDYSNNRFNFQGKICLKSSLAWGGFTLLLFYVLHPVADRIVGIFPVRTGKILLVCIILIYAVDFTVAVMESMHLREKLRSLDTVWDEFMIEIQNSRFSEIAEEWKKRAEDYRRTYTMRPMRENLLRKRELLWKHLTEKLEESERKKAFTEYYEPLIERYQEKRKQIGHNARRILKAYPYLELSEKNKAFRRLKRKNK